MQNSRFVNQKWGAIASRTKDLTEFLAKNSNLSLNNFLEKVEVKEYVKGKEEDTCNIPCIFIAEENQGSSKWSKFVNIYLTFKKEFLKVKK